MANTNPTKKRILVVDDETVTLKMTKEALEKRGYEVAIFSVPSEAFEYYKGNHEIIDLIITDKSMPKMSGIELVKKMKEFNSSTPIFVLTGFASNDDDEVLQEIGAAKILFKPLSLMELCREINDTIS